MPGRTPHEAVEDFLRPLRVAFGCVAQGKITTSPGGTSPRFGPTYQWSLNDGGGALLQRRQDAKPLPVEGSLRLFASMWWQLIEDPKNGPLRISTRGYGYSLVVGQQELWALQWQPDGPSPERKPHLHLGPLLLADDAPVTPKDHFRTGRMTFETAVRWCIANFGAQPQHNDWDNRLTLSEAPHLLHRTWHQDPPEVLAGSEA